MSIHVFPCFDFEDPRAGITVHIAAQKYGRIVRFDTVHRRAYLDKPDGTVRWASKAPVIRFPVERTRIKGDL